MARALGVVLACVFGILAARVAAQRVLTVGVGRAFPDPAAALVAARDGDLLAVDPGVYPPFVVDGVAVTIAPAVPGVIRVVATVGPAVEVRRVPAGTGVMLVGLDVQWAAGPGPAVRIAANAGRVAIRDSRITAVADRPGVDVRGMVTAEDTASLWFRTVRIDGNRRSAWTRSTWPTLPGDDGLPALFLERTPTTLHDVDLQGFDRIDPAALRAGPGLRAIDGPPVRFSRGSGETVVAGGRGGRFGGDAVQLVAARQAEVRSCGDHRFVPGFGGAGSSGEFAFDGDRGAFQTGGTSIARAVPQCRLDEGGSARIVTPFPTPGAPLEVEIWSRRSPRAYVLLASTGFGFTPVARESFQALLLPLTPLAVVDTGVLNPPNPRTLWTARLPANPGLRGISLTFQPVLSPDGGAGPVFGFGDFAVIR